MIAIIIAIDALSNRYLAGLFKEISNNNPYFFLIEHIGQNKYSTGALLNVGVRLAGLPNDFKVQFFSFFRNHWTKSNICTCLDFKTSNGYNNYEPKANVLHIKERFKNGYDQVFASIVRDTRYSNNFFHYTVHLEEDKILNLKTMLDDLNIPKKQ
jgi:hypothetical protein